MRRKIKLTDKDLELKITVTNTTDTYTINPQYDTTAECPQSVFDPGCPDYSKASCLCANNTRNCTETISRRDVANCAETYVTDCNIPVTDKSYASPCTVDDECINSNNDCFLTDDCPETEICQEASVDTCLVPNTEENVCEGQSRRCLETLINNC